MAQKYGGMANAEEFDRERACLVCDDPHPIYSWTDFSGEGYCVRCGTPYQLKWGTLAAGESYPRCNIQPQWLPLFRKYYTETGEGNGSGSFMGFSDYPDQGRDREAFNAWMKVHEADFPPTTEEAPVA